MKRYSDPVAFVGAMAVMVLIAILIVALSSMDFSTRDIGSAVIGLAYALIAVSVFRLLRKD